MAIINVNWERTESYMWMEEIDVPDEVISHGHLAIKAHIIENYLDDCRDYGYDWCENTIIFERVEDE